MIFVVHVPRYVEYVVLLYEGMHMHIFLYVYYAYVCMYVCMNVCMYVFV